MIIIEARQSSDDIKIIKTQFHFTKVKYFENINFQEVQ